MPTRVPRPEHPRPQFVRESWLNLNGPWDFAIDSGLSGLEKGWQADAAALDRRIVVPFCPESRLSGIGHTDFMPAVWYHRTFRLPAGWKGQRVLLHFGAVDHDCRAWVNGTPVGRHVGGAVSFTFDITAALRPGANDLTVYAVDDVRSGRQPGGKQCHELRSHGCMYTRVTGIWQTVWLEAVADVYLRRVRIVPDLDGSRFLVTPTLSRESRGLTLRVRLAGDKPGKRSCVEGPAVSGTTLAVPVASPRPWSPQAPFLYDLTFELESEDGVLDSVASYAGLRKFHIEGERFFLNNRPLFLRFVLDQGFYPDGIWTAPSDDELRRDVERSLAVGFNGARLHQKVFEERFHMWADRLGYLTWGEFCDWGMDFGQPQTLVNQQMEWTEVVNRDLNHPSIVAWTPFNETHGPASRHREAHRRTLADTVRLTRLLDPTRPVNDSSGYVHVDTDIYTVHDYDQNPETLQERYRSVEPDAKPDAVRRNFPDLDALYAGQPYVVDEYGGTWWNAEKAKASATNNQASWGYGKQPEGQEEVYRRIEGLTAVLTAHPHIAGFCYTQLTDVEQEQNGIYTYAREPKFEATRLRKAFSAPAAIEGD